MYLFIIPLQYIFNSCSTSPNLLACTRALCWKPPSSSSFLGAASCRPNPVASQVSCVCVSASGKVRQIQMLRTSPLRVHHFCLRQLARFNAIIASCSLKAYSTLAGYTVCAFVKTYFKNTYYKRHCKDNTCHFLYNPIEARHCTDPTHPINRSFSVELHYLLHHMRTMSVPFCKHVHTCSLRWHFSHS